MNEQPRLLTQGHIFVAVFFAVFAFLIFQLLRLLAPFASALLWAAILTLSLHPLYKKILAGVRGRAGLAASIMTLISFIAIIGPAILLLAALTDQSIDLYHWASDMVRSGSLTEAWQKLLASPVGTVFAHPSLASIDLKGMLVKNLGEFSSSLAGQIGGVLKNTLVLTLNILIMLFSLFFFFRDGEKTYHSFISLLPFTAAQKESIAGKFVNTFTAVITGVFFIAVAQGVMTGLGCALFGVPFSVFWGFLAALLALLPIGGAALVWVPAALYLLLTGATAKGIMLGLWGLLLVSLPDNFLKPLIIGKKAKLPTLLLFIGILGGIKVYGVLGILFGPIVVTLVTAFVQIYREEYGNR